MHTRCLWTILGAWLVVSCGDSDSDVIPPDAPGPYLAGYLEADVPGSQGENLQTLIWYPTQEGPELEVDYSGMDFSAGSAVRRAPAACAEPRPVVLFSHGHRGVRYQNYTLCEHFARHGFVVAAPDHPQDTVAMLDEDYIPAVFLQRPLALVDAYDWLVEQSADPESRLSGCVDPGLGFGAVGHSFGGWSVLALAGAPLDLGVLEADCVADTGEGCEVVRTWLADNPGRTEVDFGDPRIWGALAITPAFHEKFGAGLSQIAVPTFVIGGDRDTLTPWPDAVRPVYDALETTPRYLARFENTGHNTFTDFCQVLLIAGLEYNGCSDDFRAVEDVATQLLPMSLAFLQVVLGQASAHSWLGPAPGLDVWEAVE
ncbi:MAG: hypothetical protein ABI333_20605 [bacterium]